MKKPAFIIYIFLLLFGSLLVGGCDDTDEAPATEAPPPPPTDPASYTQENVCVAEFCATDATLSAQCTTFLDACIAANPEANWDECVAGGLVICQNPDASAGDVCDYGLCATDPTLNQECLDFMAICTAESLNAEECVGAMLFKCQGGEPPPPLPEDVPPPPPPTDPADYTQENVCDAEFCATDEALSAQCDTFLASCIAANPEANWDECVAGGLVVCQNPDASPGDVCDYGLCATDPTLNQECLDFMAICTAESLNAEECVGAMLFKCQL